MIAPLFSFDAHGFAANKIELPEHFGTDVDAPFRFGKVSDF